MNAGEFKRVYAKNQAYIDQFCNEHEYIYRFLPLERFLETMQSSHLVFTSPKLWKDPFDNFLFRQRVVNKDSVINKLHVCCFTLNSHSQAYWQTYAGESYCVRLKVKSKAFFQLLVEHNENISFGRMRYLKETDLTSELMNTKGLKSSLEKGSLSNLFLATFHLKRLPFEYESELRVIIQSTKSDDGLKRIKINLMDIIRDIYLDPRMGRHEEKAWKEYLMKFNIKVKKSLLFKDKNILIS